MRLSPSAHLDTFCRDRLPPPDQWPGFRFDLPELDYPERLNCAAELLDATAARYGAERPCLLSAGESGPAETWTYGETVRRTNQLAQVLTEDFGLRPGNRVLLRGPNNPWLAAAWLAVIKAGGVAVTTMALLRPREIATITGLTEPSLALCDHRFAADLAAGAPGLTVIQYGGDGPDDLAARCAAKDGAFTSVDTAADDVAMLASTSGTTGQPKVAMHFHRDVLATADTFSARLIKPDRDDVFTGTPPLGFTYGLGGLLLFPLRAGASTLLIERAAPAELADAIATHGVTVLSTAPIAYRAMLTAGKASMLKNLRRCVSAGEHLPRSVWEEFRRATGIAIIDGIGSTELLHVFIAAADGDIRPGSTGQAVPGYRAKVLDSRGREVPDGQPGRLAVQGPTGCRYLSDERHLRPRRRRLFLVPGAQRRHDHLGGLQHRRARGRGGAARPPRCGRGGRHRRARPSPRHGRAGVRGAARGRRGRPGEGRRAAGLRQVRDRAVQVPPGDRVRPRAAQDDQREDPAVPAQGNGRQANVTATGSGLLAVPSCCAWSRAGRRDGRGR
jgi:2-aminobenzoate-CoA ligase